MKPLALLITAAFAAATPIAPAQTKQELVPYQVQPGDTLTSIAEQLLINGARDWPELRRLNKLRDPRHLPVHSTLLLPVERLRGTPLTLQVAYVRGRVFIRSAAGIERPLSAGDTVREGETVRVEERSFATLQQADGSEVRLPAGSRLRMKELREIAHADRARSIFELEDGRVETAVKPQRPGARYEVRTPLATAGVRGTQFGVALSGAGMLSDVTEGRVGISPAAAATRSPATVVAAGQGSVVGSDGRVTVVPLLAPPDLSLQPALQEEMPWTVALPGNTAATGFRVQVTPPAQPEQVVEAVEVTGQAPAVIADLPDGVYRIDVRAVDANGLPGLPAQREIRVKTQPVAPLPQSPSTGRVLPLGTMHFACTDVAAVDSYLLQLSRTSDFAHAVEHRSAHACAFDVRISEEGTYHWRVASVARTAPSSDLERGPFGLAASFTASELPAAPAAEVGQDERTGEQLLRWKPVTGASYLVEIAQEQDREFGKPVFRKEVQEAEVRLRLPPVCSGRYALRIQTIAANGLRSAFSPSRWLQTATGWCSTDQTPIESGTALPWTRQ